MIRIEHASIGWRYVSRDDQPQISTVQRQLCFLMSYGCFVHSLSAPLFLLFPCVIDSWNVKFFMVIKTWPTWEVEPAERVPGDVDWEHCTRGENGPISKWNNYLCWDSSNRRKVLSFYLTNFLMCVSRRLGNRQGSRYVNWSQPSENVSPVQAP